MSVAAYKRLGRNVRAAVVASAGEIVAVSVAHAAATPTEKPVKSVLADKPERFVIPNSLNTVFAYNASKKPTFSVGTKLPPAVVVPTVIARCFTESTLFDK